MRKYSSYLYFILTLVFLLSCFDIKVEPKIDLHDIGKSDSHADTKTGQNSNTGGSPSNPPPVPSESARNSAQGFQYSVFEEDEEPDAGCARVNCVCPEVTKEVCHNFVCKGDDDEELMCLPKEGS